MAAINYDSNMLEPSSIVLTIFFYESDPFHVKAPLKYIVILTH